jgi:hypothetical protein
MNKAGVVFKPPQIVLKRIATVTNVVCRLQIFICDTGCVVNEN